MHRREARGGGVSTTSPHSTASTPHDAQLRDLANGSTAPQPDSRLPAQEALAGPDKRQFAQLLPMLPRFAGGNSLFMLMQWLDLAFARLGVKHNLSNRYGCVQSRSIKATQRHRLAYHTYTHPPAVLDEQRAGSFNDSIGSVLPICDAVALWRQHSGSTANLYDVAADMSHLVCVLIVACAAAKDQLEPAPKVATTCFGYALARLADIIGEGHSIQSLQALALMILLLRWQNEVEMAWHLLSLAVSVLHRQGLHKRTSRVNPRKVERCDALGINLFWSVFVLDKILALELERQPLLRSTECSQVLPEKLQGMRDTTFLATIRLSQLQDHLLERLKQSRKAEEAATTHAELQQLVKQKMETVGDLDQQLQAWVDGLPQDQKPPEYQYADGSSLAGTSFLAAQYHQTLFLIHRHALVHNQAYIRAQVDDLFPDKPFRNRLRNGQTVCANAARSLLSIIEHLSTAGSHSLLINTYTPMLAICALTIYIIRRQSPALAKADLELQSAAITLVAKQTRERYDAEEHPEAQGGDDLISLLTTLHDFTASYVHRSQPQSPRRPASNTAASPAFSDLTMTMSNNPSTIAAAQPTQAAGALSDPVNSAPLGDTAPWPLMSQLDMDLDIWGPDGMDMDWDSLALAYDLPSG